MKITFLPSDWDGPGCYRCLFPGRQLREQFGWDTKLPKPVSTVQDGDIKRYAFDFTDFLRLESDVFVFQLVKQVDGLEALRGLQQAGTKVVSEVDDWYAGVPAYNPGFQGTRPYRVHYAFDGERWLRRRTAKPVNRDWLHKIFSESDAISCSTPFLADWYGKLAPTKLLRNYLDWEMWDDVEQQTEVERPGGRVRVGWMGRAMYRTPDLQVLKGLLGPWLRRNPHVDFVAAGDSTVHDILDIPEGQRVTYPGVKFHEMTLPSITAVMDVGLVPLEMNRFNEAKSHLKGMEYAACGIPCIASPTESYAEYWLSGGDNGRVGMLARRPRDWIRALDTLVNDHELRRSMGRAARLKASEHTIQKNAWRWRDFYAGLVDHPADDRAGHVGAGAAELPAAA